MLASRVAPSQIAASTTWPLPDFCASNSAASTPVTRNMAPLPMSPTMCSGGVGARSGWPMALTTPDSEM
ncbi:hypothetical protein D9M71_144640 [compost metagenome]